jgi:hypothetical protein
MIKLRELKSEWVEDAKIDKLELGDEATRIPELHSKYVFLYADSKLALRKAEAEYYKTRSMMRRYYRGELSLEELQALKLKQYQGNRPLKDEMEELLNANDDLSLLKDRVEYYKTMALTLESILKSLGSRTWDVKNAIEWTKYTQGMI